MSPISAGENGPDAQDFHGVPTTISSVTGLSWAGHIPERRKRAFALTLSFRVVPSALVLGGQDLRPGFQRHPHDMVVGVLIVSMVATVGIACSATLVYLARGARLANVLPSLIEGNGG